MRMKDLSGRQPPKDLTGKVRGSRIEMEFILLPHYVIEMDGSEGELITVPISDVHDPHGQWTIYR